MVKPTLLDHEARLVGIEKQLASMEEVQDYHNKVLIRGNGQPSLVEEVHQAIQFMNEQKDNYKYWSRWIIAGIGANIIGFTVAAVIWFVRVAPLLEEVVKAHP